MNQHKNINNHSNKRYFYNEARSQQSCRAGDLSGAARVAKKNSRNLISRVFFCGKKGRKSSTLVGCAKCGCCRCSSLMGLLLLLLFARRVGRAQGEGAPISVKRIDFTNFLFIEL